ncbi:MAG: hypothetical protein HPY66_0468 [Firmicutes bacterium]|nr:hypothetical protein [Bacillota bacterium]
MKLIKKWRDISAALFEVCILFTALFAVTQRLEMAIVFGIADVAIFILLYRQNRLLHDASLICNNQIFCVPSASIVAENCTAKLILNETVVSTFGILLGSKIYKWGCDGVRGPRLKEVKLDKERIWLAFGTEDETRCIELLHGMTNKQSVLEVTQKLRHETGVTAIITDW